MRTDPTRTTHSHGAVKANLGRCSRRSQEGSDKTNISYTPKARTITIHHLTIKFFTWSAWHVGTKIDARLSVFHDTTALVRSQPYVFWISVRSSFTKYESASIFTSTYIFLNGDTIYTTNCRNTLTQMSQRPFQARTHYEIPVYKFNDKKKCRRKLAKTQCVVGRRFYCLFLFSSAKKYVFFYLTFNQIDFLPSCRMSCDKEDENGTKKNKIRTKKLQNVVRMFRFFFRFFSPRVLFMFVNVLGENSPGDKLNKRRTIFQSDNSHSLWHAIEIKRFPNDNKIRTKVNKNIRGE